MRFKSLFIQDTSVSLKSPSIRQQQFFFLEKIQFTSNNLFMILENILNIFKKYYHQY